MGHFPSMLDCNIWHRNWRIFLAPQVKKGLIISEIARDSQDLSMHDQQTENIKSQWKGDFMSP